MRLDYLRVGRLIKKVADGIIVIFEHYEREIKTVLTLDGFYSKMNKAKQVIAFGAGGSFGGDDVGLLLAENLKHLPEDCLAVGNEKASIIVNTKTGEISLIANKINILSSDSTNIACVDDTESALLKGQVQQAETKPVNINGYGFSASGISGTTITLAPSGTVSVLPNSPTSPLQTTPIILKDILKPSEVFKQDE